MPQSLNQKVATWPNGHRKWPVRAAVVFVYWVPLPGLPTNERSNDSTVLLRLTCIWSHHLCISVSDSAKFILEGADNPGIVHKITSSLAKHGLSIDKMETDQQIAPYGGSVLFKMRGIANAAAPLASGFDPAKIKEELFELGDSLNCEVTMEDQADDSYEGSFYAGWYNVLVMLCAWAHCCIQQKSIS